MKRRTLFGAWIMPLLPRFAPLGSASQVAEAAAHTIFIGDVEITGISIPQSPVKGDHWLTPDGELFVFNGECWE